MKKVVWAYSDFQMKKNRLLERPDLRLRMRTVVVPRGEKPTNNIKYSKNFCYF